MSSNSTSSSSSHPSLVSTDTVTSSNPQQHSYQKPHSPLRSSQTVQETYQSPYPTSQLRRTQGSSSPSLAFNPFTPASPLRASPAFTPKTPATPVRSVQRSSSWNAASPSLLMRSSTMRKSVSNAQIHSNGYIAPLLSAKGSLPLPTYLPPTDTLQQTASNFTPVDEPVFVQKPHAQTPFNISGHNSNFSNNTINNTPIFPFGIISGELKRQIQDTTAKLSMLKTFRDTYVIKIKFKHATQYPSPTLLPPTSQASSFPFSTKSSKKKHTMSSWGNTKKPKPPSSWSLRDNFAPKAATSAPQFYHAIELTTPSVTQLRAEIARRLKVEEEEIAQVVDSSQGVLIETDEDVVQGLFLDVYLK